MQSVDTRVLMEDVALYNTTVTNAKEIQNRKFVDDKVSITRARDLMETHCPPGERASSPSRPR